MTLQKCLRNLFQVADGKLNIFFALCILKVRRKTREMIDLYDDCVFENGNLVKLKTELIIKINELRAKSKNKWDIHTGTQVHPVKRNL